MASTSRTSQRRDIPADRVIAASPERADIADAAVAQARRWLIGQSRVRPRRGARVMERALRTEGGLGFLTSLVDGLMRPEDPLVAAAALQRASAVSTKFLAAPLAFGIKAAAWVSRGMPHLAVRISRRAVRMMVAHLVVDSRPARLAKSLHDLENQGFDVNVNLLGEAVLGQAQATARLEQTSRLIAHPAVNYVSLKVSAAIAPHSPWDVDGAVDQIVEALVPLYRTALEAERTFLNLDMEEYQDLDVTLQVFTRLMELEELATLPAGIVLQSYLPESSRALTAVQRLAQQRIAAGGAPLRVRIVKGANLPMERIHAEQRGWNAAPWGSKLATDAHYKRLLNAALTADSTPSLKVGIAGHNVFDIAYAWQLAQDRGVREAVQFEMLMGMGTQVLRAVTRDVGRVRLYTPVVAPQEFDVALAYLVRRLEEAANPHNFLSRLPTLATDSDSWDREEAAFRRACDVALDPPVTTSRRAEPPELPAYNPEQPGADEFANSPDTDPALGDSRAWAAQALERARRSDVGVETIRAARLDTADAVAQMIGEVQAAGHRWGERPAHERADLLERVAEALIEHRSQLVEVMAAETGKTVEQSDPEISEAIDFARYYALRARELDTIEGARPVPRAVTVVTPPWNFPVAIPLGSTLAALAAGSAVVLKPAEEARRCGAVIADILHAAGAAKDLVRLVDIDTDRLGAALIGDPRVDQVILTGAYETARTLLDTRPDLRLFAETSGKNALIVMPSADMDVAVRDLVASAFGHAGQKCSAASLAILVGSAADSERFHRQLRDAVTSLRVGAATEPATQVGPVIGPPTGKLRRGLTELEAGEQWWVKPQQLRDNLWSPGVRGWVEPGSFMHLVECFGPVLGIMRARDLDHAIELANAVDYGLTSGIHTLDIDDMTAWANQIDAGNLYINRATTGAIVQRQPFGGWKKSAVGATAKAGGPHYVASLTGWAPMSRGADIPSRELAPAVAGIVATCPEPWLREAAAADAVARDTYFRLAHDPAGLGSEANILRYVPTKVLVRGDGENIGALVRVCAAMAITGANGHVSVPRLLPRDLVVALEAAGISVTVEGAPAGVARCHEQRISRVRTIGAVEAEWRGDPNLAVYDGPVTSASALELLPFLAEQAISVVTHRYGEPFAPAVELAAQLGTTQLPARLT